MWILCGILLVLCIVLVCSGRMQNRSLRSAVEQLRQLEEQDSVSRVRLEAPNAAAEALLEEVNRLLALRQEERAEGRARERELRRQISNISHDLRTPLTSILGYLQLLEEGGLTEEQQTEYLGVIRGRAQTLHLRAVFPELLASFYTDFTEAGFEMEVDLPSDLPPVQADPGGVLRIGTNLLRNALDHGAGSMSIRLWQEGGTVVSSFANAAPGLEAEDVPRVFERFFTADKMRTGRNTGLGLAIVKTLGEQMGCTVTASGDQARFEIRITWPRWRERG